MPNYFFLEALLLCVKNTQISIMEKKLGAHIKLKNLATRFARRI